MHHLNEKQKLHEIKKPLIINVEYAGHNSLLILSLHNKMDSKQYSTGYTLAGLAS